MWGCPSPVHRPSADTVLFFIQKINQDPLSQNGLFEAIKEHVNVLSFEKWRISSSLRPEILCCELEELLRQAALQADVIGYKAAAPFAQPIMKADLTA